MRWLRIARNTGDSPNSSTQAQDDLFAVDDDVLASALEDLEAGLTPLHILDRYPEHADALAPLLQTAYELRTTRWPVMSMAGRLKGRERMHAALAQEGRRSGGLLSPFWRQVGVTFALIVMAGTAFLASPYSPLDIRSDADGVTATPSVVAPALAAPTFTATAGSPTPSRVATAQATATARPTARPVASAEPTDALDRVVLPLGTATAWPSATASVTRKVPPTRTRAPAATASPTATALAAATADADATQPVVPTAIPPTATPPPTPAKPSPTITVPPTAPPEPSATATVRPLPTWTNTPRPPATVQPSTTPRPSATPEPSETPRPRRTPNTPKPSDTPEPTRTPDEGVVVELPLIRHSLVEPPHAGLRQGLLRGAFAGRRP